MRVAVWAAGITERRVADLVHLLTPLDAERGDLFVVRLLLAPARISTNAPAIVWPPIGTSANYRGNVYVVIPPPLISCACENLSATAFDRNCVRLDAATPL